MKVFFHAYLRSPEKYFIYYKKIYQLLEELGYHHVNDFTVKVDPQKFLTSLEGKSSHHKRVNLYAEFIRSIRSADIMVFEISMHSLSSGFLIHEALDNEKPVVALYYEGHEPYYIFNMEDEKLQFVEYNSSNLRQRLQKSIKIAKKQMDVRFNFFISPDIINYLKWVSSEYRISKSTYIRNLIIKEIEKNKAYAEQKKR